MIELTRAPAVPVWPPASVDKRTRVVRMITRNGASRAESLSEIAAAEGITFDALIQLNFGVRKGDPSGDQWARIINWYLKNKLNAAPMGDGNFKFRGGETIYLPQTTAVEPPKPPAPVDAVQAQALQEVDAFALKPGNGTFARIGRAEVVAGLKVRIQDPSKINQGRTGLCPPASVLYALAKTNVLAYARLVMELYDNGRARFNQWLLEPCLELRNAPVPLKETDEEPKSMKPVTEAVDWIPMASMRDSVSWFHDQHDANDFDGTFIPLISGWLRRAGYTTVVDAFRLVGPASAINLELANIHYKGNYQVLMMVTGKILEGKIRLTPVTTHVVALTSPIEFGSDAEGNRTVSFKAFSWGKERQVPETGTLKMTDFLQNYFGFIACKF